MSALVEKILALQKRHEDLIIRVGEDRNTRAEHDVEDAAEIAAANATFTEILQVVK